MARKKAVNKIEKTNGMPVLISAPNLQTVEFKIIGCSPYVQNKFSAKAKAMMKAKQEAGAQAKKSTKREPKDFQACYEDAQYKPVGETWPNGAIPATSIKAAMVAACRLCDFKMTDAKQCVYIEPDGYDYSEGVPLIKISKGKPQYFEQAVRNETGVADIRARPMWVAGWEAKVNIRYDADRFQLIDVANLLMRAGKQVGIGEGRQASRRCVGLGWGEFEPVLP